MNKTTLSNPVRSIAFFLTAIILACTFGFTVDGWQASDRQAQEDGEEPKEEPEEGENTDNSGQEELPKEPEIYIPECTSRLTGLEISEESVKAAMLAFVMSSKLPAFGISSAELVCEIPTENGETRLLAFIPECENLWKIGSVTSTRGYISNIAKYFGAALISCGSDDQMSYPKCDLSGSQLDFSKNSGFHYTEYTSNVYTNRDLLVSGLSDAGISADNISKAPLPFTHPEFGEKKIKFAESVANNIRIEQSKDLVNELQFDEGTGCYTLFTNGAKKLDALNGKSLEFENCFVLFADSVTYDNSQCSQMVMDTIGEGSGFYFTNGSFDEIRWTATSGGIMTFYSMDGNKLTVNRGRTYISFLKSSMSENLFFE